MFGGKWGGGKEMENGEECLVQAPAIQVLGIRVMGAIAWGATRHMFIEYFDVYRDCSGFRDTGASGRGVALHLKARTRNP